MKIILMGLFALTMFTANAQIIISEDTTWDSDQILTQSVVVEEGATLTIAGGVHVTPIFLDVDDNQIGDISITINGQLDLQGDVCNRVVFEPYEETTDLHFWEGLYINSVDANNDLRHFNLEYSHVGLQILTEAIVDNAFITNCPVGITTQGGSLTTLENSWIYGNEGTGVLLLGGTTTINNSRIAQNGKFGVANAYTFYLVMGFCSIEENAWGGVYMGGASTNDIQNTTFLNNEGAGIEISDWAFNNDFTAPGVWEVPPSVVVHTCNFLGNAASTHDFISANDFGFVDIPDWGACQDLAQPNVDQSVTFEIPFGHISGQSAIAARYCGGGDAWQSSWDRVYTLRNAYTAADLASATQTGYLSCECGYANNLGNRYHASSKTFAGSFAPTDKYYWFLPTNSTSEHGLWDAQTSLRMGGYEVYSTVGDAADFDFTNNYWGTFIGVNELVYDVNNTNTDYSAFVTEEFPFAYAEVDDGLPVIPLGDDTNICEGTGILLDAGNPGSEYYWLPGEFNTQTLQVDEAGTYSVTVTNDCGFNSAEIEIIAVDPLPLTPIAPVGQTLLCPNSANTNYNIDDADYADSYEWTIDPMMAGSVSGTGTTAVIDWDDSFIGTATLSTKSINACGESALSTALEIDIINAPNSPGQPLGETAFCAQPASSEYMTDGSTLSETYDWAITPAEAGSIGGTGTTGTVTWDSEFVGLAEVTVTGIGYCGVGGASQALTVSIGIYEATISGSEEACFGETITLSANEADSYDWSTGEDTQLIEVTVTDAQTVTLTINDDDGCEAETSINLSSLALPDVMVSGDFDICPGGSTTLTASGGDSYLWNTSSEESQIDVNPIDNTSYSVQVIGSNGCSSEMEVDVIVHDIPEISVDGLTTLCEGQSTTLEAQGAATYVWNDGTETATNTVSPIETLTYGVIGTSSFGCDGSGGITIAVIESPEGTISGATLVCPGESTTLTASGGTSYDWEGASDQAELIVAPEESTTYTVIVSNGAGCTDTVQWLVEVSEITEAEIEGESDICSGESATLIASGGSTYLWDTSDEGAVLNVTPDQTTQYSVDVTNDDNCSITIDWIVTVHESPAIPTIVGFGSELLSSATAGNQWYYEGVPLPDATEQTFDPTQNGNYWVVVTDEFGCSSQSEPLFVDVTSVGELDNELSFMLSPNPASDMVQVQFDQWSNGLVAFDIYDSVGRKVWSLQTMVSSNGSVSLDIQELSAGSYILSAGNDGKVVTRALVVSK
jgi:hypothetical protein